MNLLDVVNAERRDPEENGRVSPRMRPRRCEVDDEVLAEVVEELVDLQYVALC